MSKVIDIHNARDSRDVIHQAVEHLVQGDLVVLPTETCYTITAYGLNTAAIQKLTEITDSQSAARYVLGLKSAAEIVDFVPEISRLGTKIARNIWPGPVVIGLNNTEQVGIFRSLPKQTRNIVEQNQAIWFQNSSNHSMISALQLLPGPVVQVCWNSDGKAKTTEEIVSRYAEDVSLIVDEGQVKNTQEEAVLRVVNHSFQTIQPGSLTAEQIKQMSQINYLFICTGNTCRSPMAEGLLRKKMAEKLNCEEDQLAENGYGVHSAGISAMYGSPASPQSVEIVGAHGGTLQEHVSQQVTDHLLNEADYIFTMTRGHRDAILSAFPDVTDRLHLLAVDGRDISDPFGGDMSAYQQCEAEILKGIEQILRDVKRPE